MKINPGIEGAISVSRLKRYHENAASQEHGWELYRWNIHLCSVFLPLIADLEVSLRNGIHDQLGKYFGRSDWWASENIILDDTTTRMLSDVVRKYQKRIEEGTAGPGKVVANSTLGVWVVLLSKGGTSSLGKAIDYETHLWRPAIRFAFSIESSTPGKTRRPPRAEVYSRAALFQELRNRVAHHEPIFEGIYRPGKSTIEDLSDVWDEMIELLGWICPDLAKLHQNENRFNKALRMKPTGK